MGEELRIRPADGSDMAAVAAIYAHYVEHTVVTFEVDAPTVAAWGKRLVELDQLRSPFLVGVLGERVIGYGYVAPWRSKPAYRYTVEDSIYLDPRCTGRGHGRRLLDQLVLAAAAHGAREVIALIASSGSGASVALHRAVGFTDVGRLRAVGYKHGRWIDVDLLQASLHPPSR